MEEYYFIYRPSDCGSRLVNYQVERHTQLNLPDLSSLDIVYEMLFLNLAPVAQMVQHLTSNQKVLGSNPSGSRFFTGHVSLSLC